MVNPSSGTQKQQQQKKQEQQHAEDAELAEAIRESEAMARAQAEYEAIAATTNGAATAASIASPLLSLSDHAKTLIDSFCTLLLEQSTIDKADLTQRNPTLQLIAQHTESWIDWTEEDARVAAEAAEIEARHAEQTAAKEAHEMAVAVAVVDGTPPPTFVPKKYDPIVQHIVSENIALQLKFQHGDRFFHYLLQECLIRPHPLTHANTAYFQTSSSRRICFALLEIVCHEDEEMLRLLLAWLQEHHCQETSDKSQRLVAEDDWDIDPNEYQRSSTGFVGLKNQAATCYQNSLIQQLFHCVEFKQELMNMREIEDSDEKNDGGADENEQSTSDDSTRIVRANSLLSRLQTIFYYLSHSLRKSYDPMEFVKTFCGSDGCPVNPREQQDVLEFCNLLFERLETNLDVAFPAIESSSASSSSSSSQQQTNLMKKYFRGETRDELLCTEYYTNQNTLHRRPTRIEAFYPLSLDINGCLSLEQCLNKFVTGDNLDGGYKCDVCGEKKETKKRCIIHTWPRLVVFHLKRFAFDFELLKTKKLNDEVSFPIEIDLEPYTEQGMTRRDRMERERPEKEAKAKEAGLTLEEWEQFEAANGNAAASTSSSVPSKQLYRLVGVLVHAGHAEGGHYYSYIRSRTDPEKWHEFNDQIISPFNPDHLAREAFGGVEDELGGGTGDTEDPTKGMTEVISKRQRKRRNQQQRTAGAATANGKNGDEWEKPKIEKNRSAYLLWYELIEPETEKKQQEPSEEKSSTDASTVNGVTNSLTSLSISSPKSPNTSLYSTPLLSLPPYLRHVHRNILKENAAQMKQEIFLENAYLDMMYKVARANIEWVPTKEKENEEPKEEEKESDEVIVKSSGSVYLNDIDAELDPTDLSVLYLKNFTLFVLHTVAHVKDDHRVTQWMSLLQHGYSRHVGCCQWFLQRFILQPKEMITLFHECPTASTRSALASLCELVVKKLIRFEVDPLFDESVHIVLPVLKELRKREDAQASLAAALLGGGAAASSSSSAAVIDSTPLSSSSSTGDSILASDLVQQASVPAQSAPAGMFKPTAKSTVAVSAKLAVLEGLGGGTQKQFGSVNIRTLQQLVEITPAQRQAIDRAPTGGMSQQQLQEFVDRAQAAVDFILEKSGVNEQLRAMKQAQEEVQAARRAALGSHFQGPRLIPAFIRTCLDTLEHIVTSRGINSHTCPELCTMLTHLASVNESLCRMLIEQGTVEKCIDVIISPVTTVEQAKFERLMRKQEKEADEAAAAAAVVDKEDANEDEEEAGEDEEEEGEDDEEEEEEEAEAKVDGDESTTEKKKDGDDDDEPDDMSDLEDLTYVELVGLIEVLVRACTTRSGKVGQAIKLIDNSPLSAATFERLHAAPFLTRLVLQISATKPDPPSTLAYHLAWENLDFTDRLLNEIFKCVEERDFFDFYSAIKIWQQLLLLCHDSIHDYRVQLSLPRLTQLTKLNQEYYKSTELCIKAFMHVVQNVPQCSSWCKLHQEEVKWMESYLTKNRSMPKVNKDGTAIANPPEGVALYVVKAGKHEGVNERWEKNWINQIDEYGLGLGALDGIQDYQRIWKKMILQVKIRK